MLLDSIRREHLTRAVIADETISDLDALRILDALRRVRDGTQVEIEVPNGTDGTTPLEIVALALDYYFS